MRDRIARRAGLALLERIDGGYLELTEEGHSHESGTQDSDLRARVELRSPRAWPRLLRGSRGLAAGYAHGEWDSADPVAVVRIAARNMSGFDRLRRRFGPALRVAQRLAHRVPRNTRRGARDHIGAHYDLGNQLFSAFLDERLVYSCAYFERDDASLGEAQLAKLDRICRRLELGPGDHMLEIGTGWGGLAIHAASEYGCEVTTTTISDEQREYAARRVAELGLSDRVTVLGADYRELTGRFSKLASIEMIEAVGWQYFKRFFRTCSERLEQGGLMLLQAIVIDDALYEVEKSSRSFANTQVFPGGCLPSEGVIRDLVRKVTDLVPTWSDDITPHYATTLHLWRERFRKAGPALERMGYDRRFRRLWEFYLAFSEAGFRERRIRDLQMLFSKPGARSATGPVAADAVPAGR